MATFCLLPTDPPTPPPVSAPQRRRLGTTGPDVFWLGRLETFLWTRRTQWSTLALGCSRPGVRTLGVQKAPSLFAFGCKLRKTGRAHVTPHERFTCSDTLFSSVTFCLQSFTSAAQFLERGDLCTFFFF